MDSEVGAEQPVMSSNLLGGTDRVDKEGSNTAVVMVDTDTTTKKNKKKRVKKQIGLPPDHPFAGKGQEKKHLPDDHPFADNDKTQRSRLSKKNKKEDDGLDDGAMFLNPLY